jgi:hypothetical protein
MSLYRYSVRDHPAVPKGCLQPGTQATKRFIQDDAINVQGRQKQRGNQRLIQSQGNAHTRFIRKLKCPAAQRGYGLAEQALRP